MGKGLLEGTSNWTQRLTGWPIRKTGVGPGPHCVECPPLLLGQGHSLKPLGQIQPSTSFYK